MATIDDQTLASKQQKTTSSDKIGDLPDELIHHILSFVPTKQTVATSILSKRWLKLWTLVPILDFEDSPDCCVNYEIQQQFIQFVSNVFQLNKSPSLEKLHLKFCPCYTHLSPVNEWIFSATARGLQELDISFSSINKNFQRWRFFDVIRMLKILKLSGIVVDFHGEVSFPNLKILHLVFVTYRDDRSVRNLFSGCLVLQELLVKRTPNHHVLDFNVSVPTLKSLSIEIVGLWEHNVEINSPALEYLNFKDDTSSQNLLGTIPAGSTDRIISPLCKRTTQILREVCCVKSLSLSGNIWRNELEHDYNPIFANLVRLELNVGLYGWDLVSLLLENSPILQDLVLSVSEALQVENEQPKSLPKHVPKCFWSHLETVRFRKFAGLEYELRLIEYILTNARVLKRLTICSDSHFSYSDFQVHNKLSMIPRCVGTCLLEFKCLESD